MAVHEKKESFKEHNDRGSILLAFYFVLTLLIPNLVLLYTEPYSIWSAEASLFIPMGFYLMWSAVLKRSGIMIWLAFPLVVLAAFQIVLLYLFGNSIIATDMFTNLLTTNPEEAGELLSNIYLSIIIVCAIYLPLLWFASRDIGQRHCLSKTARKNIALIGLSSFILGGLFLAPAYKVSEDKRVLKTDIFPVNVFYNIGPLRFGVPQNVPFRTHLGGFHIPCTAHGRGFQTRDLRLCNRRSIPGRQLATVRLPQGNESLSDPHRGSGRIPEYSHTEQYHAQKRALDSFVGKNRSTRRTIPSQGASGTSSKEAGFKPGFFPTSAPREP